MSEFQTPLYSIASYTGVRISDTLIFYCELYGCLKLKHPYILLRVIYGCLKFRHRYILLRVIWVSDFQTHLYSIASYMGV